MHTTELGIVSGVRFEAPIALELVTGDLVDQRADVLVNAWNRNIIPWWLLLPQGVSGRLKKVAGLAPFREVGRVGPIPLGGAVATSAGKLPNRAIIHVAGIDVFWRASPRSVEGSVHAACVLARRLEARSIAFPIIGAGSGGLSAERAEAIMLDVLRPLESSAPELTVTLVRHGR